MWPNNDLTARMRIERPIIQAPMAGAATPRLAAAVSNAGGLGGLGFGTSTTAEIAEAIEEFRERSPGPLNANFMCHEEPRNVEGSAEEMRARLQPWYDVRGLSEVPQPAVSFHTFGEDDLEVIRETRPEVVSFHFGLPAPHLLDAVRETGAFIVSSATTVAEARWLEAHGVDAIIAQGLEAGGHRGTFQGADPTAQPGLFSLLPQVAVAVSVPVIAAGGIIDGRTIAAAFVLGASAVQIGTAFLRTPEAQVHPAHRAALADASDDGTRVTRLFSGKPARSLINRYMEELRDAEDLAAPYPSQGALLSPLAGDGSAPDVGDLISLWAGQGAALTREMPAADLVDVLFEEADKRLREFC